MHPLAGIDIFCHQHTAADNCRYAMVTNDAATTSNGILSRVAIVATGKKLVKIFSPEHGIKTTGADGAMQPDVIDQATGLPVISLYGTTLKPTTADLSDVDAVLFDIPDVGCRFYTYLWTLTYIIEACAENNKRLIILDRPNPLGGNLELAEGPMLDEMHCSSFIGRWSIPVRHSCTLGELAAYFATIKTPGLQLKIIKCEQWDRHQSFFQFPALFHPTSPAIRDIETALLYPGTGLWEGVNLHEGRGTTTPFKIVGSPWMDNQIVEAISQISLPGLQCTYETFTPVAGRFSKEPCHGFRLTITNENVFRPVATGIALLQQIGQCYPHQFQEAAYPTLANPAGEKHLEKLLGIKAVFQEILSMQPLPINIAEAWSKTMSPHLLY